MHITSPDARPRRKAFFHPAARAWEENPIRGSRGEAYKQRDSDGEVSAPLPRMEATIPGRESSPNTRTGWIALLWLMQAGLLAFDVATGPDLSLLGFFLIPAMLAATFAPARQVFLLAAAALIGGLFIGWTFGLLANSGFMVRLGALAAIGGLAVFIDQARERSAAALVNEHARVRATLDSLLDPHVLLRATRDARGTITDFIFADANEAACRYNRLPRAGVVGHRLLELLPSHVATGLLDLYRQTIESGRPLVLDDYLYPHDILEEPRYYDIRGVKVGDALSFTWRDVTERHNTAASLEQRARTDELTKLLNRRGVFEKLEDLRGKSPRTGRDIAVLFVDFDKFKSINDGYGHAAGDEVLRVTAEKLRACLRHSDDLGARVGGNEMMIVLHGVHGMNDAVAVAEKLRRSAATPVRFDNQSIEATVSVGVALARHGESTDALVARADAAMYEAKQSGRNQVISVEEPVAA